MWHWQVAESEQNKTQTALSQFHLKRQGWRDGFQVSRWRCCWKGVTQRGTMLLLSGAIPSFYTRGSFKSNARSWQRLTIKWKTDWFHPLRQPSLCSHLLLELPLVFCHYCSSSVPFLFLLNSFPFSPLHHTYPISPQPFNPRRDKSVILYIFLFAVPNVTESESSSP